MTPQTIHKSTEKIETTTRVADARGAPVPKVSETKATHADEVNKEGYINIKILDKEMPDTAKALGFERAALLRAQLFEIRVAVGAKQ